MSKAKTYFIPTQRAYELIGSHDLGEVLRNLQSLKLIDGFKIGLKHVEIQSKAQKRFELAFHLEAETCAQPIEKPSKRAV